MAEKAFGSSSLNQAAEAAFNRLAKARLRAVEEWAAEYKRLNGEGWGGLTGDGWRD